MAQEIGGDLGGSSHHAADKTSSGGVTKADDVVLEVPLDSALRTEPIHALIKEVKLPATIPRAVTTSPTGATNPTNAANATNAPFTTLNPITLQSFTIDELRAHKLESLLSQYPTPEAAMKAREDTAAELRKLLDENEKKNKEIDREMEEKEKTREFERKVYAKKLGKDP